MLDVEFLLNPPVSLSRPLIYRYRTGLLRGPLKSALRAIAERNGELVSCTPAEFPYLSAGGELFPSLIQCDWPAGRTKVSELDGVLGALSIQDRPLALLVPESHGLFSRGLWPAVGRACFVVEEPIVSGATLSAILSYFVGQAMPDFAEGLLEQKPFRGYFERLVAGGKCPDLPSFWQELERVVLLHVDPNTGIFSNEAARTDRRGARNELLRPLRKFVEQSDPGALSDLIHGLAARFPTGRSSSELADELGRLTRNLFASLVAGASSRRARGTEWASQSIAGHCDPLATSLVLWAAVLITWMSRISENGSATQLERPNADSSLVEIDQLGREFIRRSTLMSPADPVSGLWSALDRAAKTFDGASEELGTVQGVLVNVLARRLAESAPGEPRWISRLRLLFVDKPVEGTSHSERVERSDREQLPLQNQPTCFAEVIGHQATVDRLRRRLHEHENGTPIILCGPEGIGKRTLGRLYAKGLMCEDLGSELPCGSCLSCREFSGSGTLDFIQFDAGCADAADYVQRQLLPNIRYASFARRRPILIANADKAPRVVDMCLKTLETRSEIIRFIFTITSSERMIATGQSRSDIYRLIPLADCDARKIAKRSLGEVADERLIDLVTGSASGLPRRLVEACAVILAAKAGALDDARRALRLDWGERATSYWRTLLSPQKAEDIRMGLPDGWSVSEAVSRLRSVLTEIRCVQLTGRTHNAALVHLENDPVGELAAMLDVRSRESGRSFSELWAALAQHWISTETTDPLGFMDVGLEARAIIGG